MQAQTHREEYVRDGNMSQRAAGLRGSEVGETGSGAEPAEENGIRLKATAG